MPVQFINYSSSTVESMGIIIILYSQQQGEENTRICKSKKIFAFSYVFRWVQMSEFKWKYIFKKHRIFCKSQSFKSKTELKVHVVLLAKLTNQEQA